MPSNYVFLTEVADLSEAQVIKGLLESMHLQPRLRDEQLRSIAPHLSQLLGKIVIEIPEDEFGKASQALEVIENQPKLEIATEQAVQETHTTFTQELAKKALLSSILGCTLVPLLCNLFSLVLSYRVIRGERPLTAVSGKRLMWALFFNAVGFSIWLKIGPKYFFHF